MPRDKREFRIRCSGRGKPRHSARTHTYRVKDRDKGFDAVWRWEAEASTPGALACLPMIVESRVVTVWAAHVEALL